MMSYFPYTDTGAKFSEDGKHRLLLWRTWTVLPKFRTLVVIGLNPSTANGENDDPTISRVVSIANYNGYGSIIMLNLYTQITPHPKELNADCQEDIQNVRSSITNAVENGYDFLCAWGNFIQADLRVAMVAKLIKESKCYTIHINKNGSPKHPLYCKTESLIIPYHPQRQLQESP